VVQLRWRHAGWSERGGGAMFAREKRRLRDSWWPEVAFRRSALPRTGLVAFSISPGC